MRAVREERTGWRDEGLSGRHRKWGCDCPAVDLDFLLIEYDRGEPVALVEYKNEHAQIQYPTTPSYLALISLGNKCGIPVLGVRYASDFSWWKVVPLNKEAKKFLPEIKQMNEKDWVSFLYRMRGRELPQELIESWNMQI